MFCKVCATKATPFDQATVLNKHRVQYFHCPHCGFVQTEEPYWLKDAYSAAITHTDIGLVSRNVVQFEQAKLLILAFFDDRGKFVDYGGGYGMFVRLMRDAGLDFYLYDAYCENLFAAGFAVEEPSEGGYELVTAFEVFEHLANPLAEIDKMRQFSSSILFSTTLVPQPPPLPTAWWYYGLEHGQHVALYSYQSLLFIAKRLGVNLYSDGRFLHLLTPKKISARIFAVIQKRFLRRLAKMWLQRRLKGRSLQASDYERIAGRPLS